MQLLRAGAETEARNSGGETAMHAAAGRGHGDIIDALVAAGTTRAAMSAAVCRGWAECGNGVGAVASSRVMSRVADEQLVAW